MLSKVKFQFILSVVINLIAFTSKAIPDEEVGLSTLEKFKGNSFVTLDDLYTKCMDIHEIRLLHVQVDRAIANQKTKILNNLIYGKYLHILSAIITCSIISLYGPNVHLGH